MFISVDLPAPFSPNERIEPAAADGDLHVVERLDAGKRLADAVRVQQHVGFGGHVVVDRS